MPRKFSSCAYIKFDLDYNTTSINKTYIQVNKTNNHVIFDHTTFLKDQFNLEVDEKKERNFVTSTGHLNFVKIPPKPGLHFLPHSDLLNIYLKL